MSVKVTIPFYFRHYTNGVEVTEVDGVTIEECLREVIKQFPKLDEVLFPEDSRLDDFINIAINQKLLTFKDKPLTRHVSTGDEISLFVLLGGG